MSFPHPLDGGAKKRGGQQRLMSCFESRLSLRVLLGSLSSHSLSERQIRSARKMAGDGAIRARVLRKDEMRDGWLEEALPLPMSEESHSRLLAPKPLVSITIPQMLIFTCGAPLLAMTLVITIAITYHHRQATQTHCRVSNWLPSISAAVSGLDPELPLWRFLIGLHIGPRFILVSLYRSFFKSHFGSRYAVHREADAAFHVAELLSLLALTTVASHEDEQLHRFFTFFFLLMFIGHLFISTFLFHRLHHHHQDPTVPPTYINNSSPSSPTSLHLQNTKSLAFKKYLTLWTVALTAIGGYYFYRHMEFCQVS